MTSIYNFWVRPFARGQIRTRDGRVRSVNLTYMLCCPPIIPIINSLLNNQIELIQVIKNS